MEIKIHFVDFALNAKGDRIISAVAKIIGMMLLCCITPALRPAYPG